MTDQPAHTSRPDTTTPGTTAPDTTVPGPADLPVTEQVNPGTTGIDTLPTLEQVRLMNAQDALVAPAVGRCAEVIATVVDVVAERLRSGG